MSLEATPTGTRWPERASVSKTQAADETVCDGGAGQLSGGDIRPLPLPGLPSRRPFLTYLIALVKIPEKKVWPGTLGWERPGICRRLRDVLKRATWHPRPPTYPRQKCVASVFRGQCLLSFAWPVSFDHDVGGPGRVSRSLVDCAAEVVAYSTPSSTVATLNPAAWKTSFAIRSVS